VDQSAQNNLITRNGNASQGAYSPLVPSTWSAYFDGTGDYLSIARNTNLIPVANEDFTFEAWVYVTATPGVTNAHIMGLQEYGTNGDWILSITSSLQLSLWVLTDQGSVPYPGYTNTARSIPLNSWTHIAATRSGTGSNNLKLFVNGTGQAFSTNSTLVGAGNYNFSLGADQNGDESNFTGYISNMRIVKGTGLYTSNFVPPAAPALPTTANTSLLLNFTNSGVVDATGRNVLETLNDARVTTSLSKYGSGSYYFDGTGDYMYVMGTSSEMAFGTGDFTVEFWVYPAAANQTATIIGWRPTNTNGAYINLYLLSGSIYLYVSSADRISGGSVSASAWSHIALARSNGVTKLFLNGTQTGSNYTDSNSYLVGANRPLIGANDYDVSSPFNGYIDDLRITKGYARYTANFTAPTAPFVTK
jgi:hypothetical protein